MGRGDGAAIGTGVGAATGIGVGAGIGVGRVAGPALSIVATGETNFAVGRGVGAGTGTGIGAGAGRNVPFSVRLLMTSCSPFGTVIGTGTLTLIFSVGPPYVDIGTTALKVEP